MKKAKLLLFGLIVLFGVSSIPIVNIQIDVAPNVLNLLNKGSVVTIHTDVDYGLVVGSSVFLNGILIQSWKADDRGDFVAKFNMDAIKGLPLKIGVYNELKISGLLTTGEEFTGTQQILVVNNTPKK
jgi:hypothetical protein